MAAIQNGGRWQDEADPELRPLVLRQLEATMAGLCTALYKGRSPPQDLSQYVADFEEKTFQTAKDMIDYMKMIAIRVSFGQKEAAQLKAKAAADRQKKMQMVHQMQMANMVQPIQGVNQAVPMTTSHSSPPFQSPNQHMACSVGPSMNRNVNQGPSDMTMLYQNFSSEPATAAVVAPGVQSSQQIIQSISMQTESQSPAMQLQPTNIVHCHPASTVQMQGQQIARPNVGHQNHLLRQNVWDSQHLLPTVEQEQFLITQQQVGMQMQSYQMLGANVGKMNAGYSGGWNNQQNGWASGIQSPSKVCGQTNMNSHSISPSQNQITVSQQSNLHCPLSHYESISQTRQNIVATLVAGQETHSHQSQGVTSPYFSYQSPGALQSSLSSNDVELCCTPSPISKFWAASPNESPKSRSQSPIAKQGLVAAGSPCVSVKSALTSAEKTQIEVAASPCTLVKPVSPSAIVKSGTVPTAVPSDSDSSVLLQNDAAVNARKQATTTELSTPVPPADQAGEQEHARAETPLPKTPPPPADQAEDQEHVGTETPVANTPAPSADQAEDQEHGGAETPVAGTPGPPADQAQDQEHGGAETPVAQKPVDRLVAAVLSSSPEAISSSFSLMKSAIIDMDSVPLPTGPNKEMKRVHAVASTSESPTLSSTDGSTSESPTLSSTDGSTSESPTLSSTDGSTETFESNASDTASSGYHSKCQGCSA